MRPLLMVPVVILIVASAAPWLTSYPTAPGTDTSWRSAAIWDDGQAEFSVYATGWPRYGHVNPGRTMLVLVKEPWAPDSDVKADRPGPDSFDVIKLNHVRDVRTGLYEYHQMASVFVRRDDGRLRKLAVASIEACGLTTSDMTKGQLRTRSYLDGQADRTISWPAGALPEDGLPLHLRDFVSGQLPRTVSIFPTLMTGAHAPLEPTTYEISRQDIPSITVPAGTFAAVELKLTAGEKTATYTFEKDSPHRLLLLQKSDGTVSRLVKSERLPYWTMNRPGGEKWLPEELR